MFNEKLIEHRKINSDTQEALASKLNVSRSLVAKWEQGRAFPNYNDLNKICEIYSIELEALLSKQEIKEQYSFLVNKNKHKNFIIIIVSIFAFILLITSILLSTILPNKIVKSKVITYKTINISNIEDNKITLADGSIINNIYEYKITFDSIEYKYYSLTNVTSGNFVKYEVTNGYNKNKKLIDVDKRIIQIDLKTPTVNKDDLYVTGAYISFNKNSNLFNEAACAYIKIDYKDRPVLSASDKCSNLTVIDRYDQASGYSYTHVKSTVYVDMNKIITKPLDTVNIKQNYFYSKDTMNITEGINYLFPNENELNYNLQIPSTGNIKNYSDNEIYKFLSQGLSYDNKPIFFLLEFEIAKKNNPDYYEIFEFDHNNNVVDIKYVYSFDDINNLFFNLSTDRILINSIYNSEVLESNYIIKGEDIYFSFSNEYGLFENKIIKFN